jgi:hypothetical protein
MAMYTANSVVKTLTIHKPDCQWAQRGNPGLACGCREGGEKGNQRWYCENHMNIDEVNEFMKGKYWAILLCDACFR